MITYAQFWLCFFIFTDSQLNSTSEVKKDEYVVNQAGGLPKKLILEFFFYLPTEYLHVLNTLAFVFSGRALWWSF